MSVAQKLRDEIKELALAMLYFASFLGVLMLVKTLLLEEYRIEFSGWSRILVGVLVLAKVVLVLEHVPLGALVRARPAWLDVLLRTMLYGVGVFMVGVLEAAFEGRHEYHGFGLSLEAVFRHADRAHILVNTICLSGALLGYNILAVIRRHLGKGELLQLFLSPLPEESSPRGTKIEP